MFKLKEVGVPKVVLFRIVNLEQIRLHFQSHKSAEGKFPVIEISPTEIRFGRQISSGILDIKSTFYKNFEVGSTYDLFLFTNGTEVRFGLVLNGFLNVLGFSTYDELDSLAFIGFSSSNNADWILEEAESGERIKIKGTFLPSLNITCKVNPGTGLADWTFPDGLNLQDFSSAECEAAHSCLMSNLEHDNSVRVVSYKDHLGNNLRVDDAVKLGDVAIARCSDSGEVSTSLISIFETKHFTEYTFSGEALELSQTFKFGGKEIDLNKMLGTCTANVTGDGGSPGWVWSNEAGTVLGYNSSLPGCSRRSAQHGGQ